MWVNVMSKSASQAWGMRIHDFNFHAGAMHGVTLAPDKEALLPPPPFLPKTNCLRICTYFRTSASSQPTMDVSDYHIPMYRHVVFTYSCTGTPQFLTCSRWCSMTILWHKGSCLTGNEASRTHRPAMAAAGNTVGVAAGYTC